MDKIIYLIGISILLLYGVRKSKIEIGIEEKPKEIKNIFIKILFAIPIIVLGGIGVTIGGSMVILTIVSIPILFVIAYFTNSLEINGKKIGFRRNK